GGTIKLAAADGAVVWQKSGGAGLVVTPAGNVAVFSGTVVTEYAGADGTQLWQRTLPTSISTLASATNGDIALTGQSNNNGLIAKLDGSNGNVVWQNTFSADQTNGKFFNAVAFDANENVYATGYINGPSFFYPSSITVKYTAADGSALWTKFVGPS